MKLVAVLLLAIAGQAIAGVQQCVPLQNQDGSNTLCTDDTDPDDIKEVGVDSCGNYDSCCVYTDFGTGSESCVANAANNNEIPMDDSEDALNEFFGSTAKFIDDANAQNVVQQRSLGYPILPGLPGACVPPVPFPGKCKPTKNEPFVLVPPVDIPYCLRIPCQPANNKPLDKNLRQCGSQPGCYFDQALFEYREAFGPSVLPGVPVCHLAIRNRVFQVNARKVVVTYGTWNPYFTNCLLNEYQDEIAAGPKGCELLPILDAFKVLPKLAGWRTITSRECAYIDACWRPQRGCFYPVDLSNIRVKSGQREVTYRRNEIVFGRPRCQHFDSSSPLAILKSYHRCLSAGCTVDSSVTDLYYNHLFSLGNQLTPENHWKYWGDVERGHIGAYNIDSTLNEYGYTGSGPSLPRGPTIPPPTTDSGFPFPLPGIGGSSSVGLPPGPPFSFAPPSPNKNCGFLHRPQGGRPCEPPKLGKSHKGQYCPYKPFFVPRFPRLTGSFDGCCEINLCYLPKSEISRMHSGPSYYYSEWSVFTECSVTCGRGSRTRYRRCVSKDRSLCKEPLKEVRSCSPKPCPGWTPWGPWSPCPNTCGSGGIQQRSRLCLPRGGFCEGKGEEVKECKLGPCNTKPPYVNGEPATRPPPPPPSPTYEQDPFTFDFNFG